MVDCFDRIAVQMTEMALEPVRQLAQLQMLTGVSLRIASGGLKYEVRILKRLDASAINYFWQLQEINHRGDPTTAGIEGDHAYDDPESAWWGAVDAMCGLKR